MSDTQKVLESLHTLSDEEQAKVLQDLTDNGETECTPTSKESYDADSIGGGCPTNH